MSRQHALDLYRRLILPVHKGLLAEFGIPRSPGADALSIASAYQESKCRVRDQGDDNIVGPATGFWQFEKNGGVAEIMESGKTGPIMQTLCERIGVNWTRDAIWRLFVTPDGDELACSFARGLTWKDPRALPPADASGRDFAYRYYDDNWRPSKERPHDWPESWDVALWVLQQDHGDVPPIIPAPPVIAPPVAVEDADLRRRVDKLEKLLADAGAVFSR